MSGLGEKISLIYAALIQGFAIQINEDMLFMVGPKEKFFM